MCIALYGICSHEVRPAFVMPSSDKFLTWLFMIWSGSVPLVLSEYVRIDHRLNVGHCVSIEH